MSLAARIMQWKRMRSEKGRRQVSKLSGAVLTGREDSAKEERVGPRAGSHFPANTWKEMCLQKVSTWWGRGRLQM